MRLLPASLAARTVLLVVAVVAVAQIATFSLIFQHRLATHMSQTVQHIAGQVRLLQAILPGLDAQIRRRLAAAERGADGLQLFPDGALVPEHVPEFKFAQRLAVDLEQSLGQTVSLRHAGRGQHSGLWIGFMADGERWWLLLPPPRFTPQALPPDLWLGLSGALALLVLCAVLFVRGIVGPLARLGDAVAATGDGQARRVTPQGPTEVRRLAERHNTMLAQLALSNAERREMLAGLTHDLRAPLARLRVRLALLENDTERSGLIRDVEDIERIVGQCLAFLRSEESSAEPAPPLLLADAVSNELARQRELGRPVKMSVSETAAACWVAISPGNLQRLLDNLIENALQYGAPPVELSLSLERADTITLQVRDHGPGIAAEQRSYALEAFAQIDSARATGGSCGLGLAIVRRIVSACGGEIRLGEAQDGGLTVVLTFPVHSAHINHRPVLA
ncbi:ATP-binding protein [Propionivibrio sp.]|uniref:ATP-binding protein n=1 Tax=Propionivibrio sp. TaxID=2212460 RepID=UPI002615E7B9|nr:ATP-binding protein [Propionivibrio sp.]